MEYHEFSMVQRVAVDGRPLPERFAPPLETLVVRSITPGETSVEMLMGRPLASGDESRPVSVARGPEQLNEHLDEPLGPKVTYNVAGTEVTLETVGLTRNAPPVPGGFEDASLLAPIGAIDPSIPRTAISFSMTVPDS